VQVLFQWNDLKSVLEHPNIELGFCERKRKTKTKESQRTTANNRFLENVA